MNPGLDVAAPIPPLLLLLDEGLNVPRLHPHRRGVVIISIILLMELIGLIAVIPGGMIIIAVVSIIALFGGAAGISAGEVAV